MRSRLTVTIAALTIVTLACGRSAELQDTSDISYRAPGEVTRDLPPDDLAPPISKAELASFQPLPSAMVRGAEHPTKAQVDLGRRLFHETLLSGKHDVSCNSCHPLNGYGADGRRVSLGTVGQTGGRNAPTVYNAAGHMAQFWDGRAASVEEQAKGPILNPAEMAMPDSSEVLQHLRKSPDYRAAFDEAFPGETNPVTYENVGRAIGAFERGLVTPARWDAYLTGDTAKLSGAEQRGLVLFVRAGCSSCHSGAYVGGQSFQKLGARLAWPVATDSGRFNVTHKPTDLYVFKVASLRNVEKTAPYFHDGSVPTLPQAVRLMGRHQLAVDLTEDQVRDIRLYLGSLTGQIPAGYIAEPPLPGR